MTPPDDEPLDAEPLELDDAPPADLPVADVVSVRCWRCDRLEVPRAGACPACGARLQSEPGGTRSRAPRRRIVAPQPANPLNTVLVLYCVLLGISVVWALVLMVGGNPTPDVVTTGTTVIGVLDLILALIGIAMVGALALPDQSGERRAVAWAVAWPALGVLLGLNLLYFGAIKQYVDPPKFLTPPTPPLDVVTVLLVCVQPAVVEELFFRFLAFGVLYRAAGTGTAVVVSSVMFAMAHIYNPIGVPYFFVAGVVFAYARIYGGLLLPMILHFLHNLAVTMIEVGK